MGLAPGDLVSQHVRLVRELQRGGMGSVWIADHQALSTQVAVKFMSAAIAKDPAAAERFSREATSAAQIKSPHVVQVLDHGLTPEGVPYMIMELLHGEDLSARIKRAGPLSPGATAEVVLQTCRVLSKAHALGIIHRDIKPSNIFLLDTDGEVFVKVLDFGVAKLAGDKELTNTGVTVGTVVYMSPEQLLSAKRVDHRADLWSLAVVAYRSLTGELPFDNEDGLGALCRALEDGAFSPASARVPGLPPAVDAWFERAFHPTLDARFSSAKEMAEALQGALGRGVDPASMVSTVAPSLAAMKAAGPRGEATISEPAVSRSGGKGAADASSSQTLAGTAAAATPGKGRAARVAGAVLLAFAVGGAASIALRRGSSTGRSAPASAAVAPASAPTAVEKPPAPPIATATMTSSVAPPPASASAPPSPTATASVKPRGRLKGPEKDYGF